MDITSLYNVTSGAVKQAAESSAIGKLTPGRKILLLIVFLLRLWRISTPRTVICQMQKTKRSSGRWERPRIHMISR